MGCQVCPTPQQHLPCPLPQRTVTAAQRRGVTAARRGGLQICASINPNAERALMGEVRLHRGPAAAPAAVGECRAAADSNRCEHCELRLRASARALVLTQADGLLMLPQCSYCCRAGWQDFGARDPTAGELGSNFGDKVLGNYNTEHIIK